MRKSKDTAKLGSNALRMKGKYKVYTEEQKMEVLAVLKGNGGNLSKTSRETGIRTTTISQWRDRRKMMEEKHPEFIEATVLTEERIDELEKVSRADFIQKAEDTRFKLLEKLKSLSEKCVTAEHIKEVSVAFKVVSEAIQNAEPSSETANMNRRNFDSINHYIENYKK